MNNVDVTHALQDFALSQYALHQFSNRALRLRVRGNHATEPLANALHALFGTDASSEIETGYEFAGKVVQYTRDTINAG